MVREDALQGVRYQDLEANRLKVRWCAPLRKGDGKKMTHECAPKILTSGLLATLWLSSCISGGIDSRTQSGAGGAAGRIGAASAGASMQSGGARNSAQIPNSGGTGGLGSPTAPRHALEPASAGAPVQSSGEAPLSGGTVASTEIDGNASGGTATSSGSASSAGGDMIGGDMATSGGTAAIGGSWTGATTQSTGGVPMGGTSSTHIETSDIGGTSTTGGTTSAGGTSNSGGTTASGSNSTSGGTSAIGGTTSAGGTSATGGTLATGGTSTTGETSTGGCKLAPGNALSFDSATQPQYVSLPDNAALHLTNAITIEAWVRSGMSNQYYTNVVVAKPVGTSSASSFLFYIDRKGSTEPAYLYFASGSANLARAALPPSTNVWRHIAVTANDSAQQLYVDGVLVQVTSAAFAPSYDWHPLLIGADSVEGRLTYGLKGAIDEVRIYSSVRTAQQIVSDMKGDCDSIHDPSLVVYLPFDEGSGTVARDASANHLEGTLGNPAATGAEPTWITSSVPF